MSLLLASLVAFAQPSTNATPSHAPQPRSQPITAGSATDLSAPTGSEMPPSATKLALIRRYLQLNGIQRQIDTGSFLDRYALPGGPLSQAIATRSDSTTFGDLFRLPVETLRRLYGPHRHVWQEAYERHVNWEYSESELRQIVAFLESDAGRHFLTGEWRMNAYVGTNMQELLERIVRQAEAELRSSGRGD